MWGNCQSVSALWSISWLYYVTQLTIQTCHFHYMGSLISIQWYYHSRCFKAVSSTSQCHLGLLIARSPALPTTVTDWCLIRKTGCRLPEDIIDWDANGCLLIVMLIKFIHLKSQLPCGPSPIIPGSTSEHTRKNQMIDMLFLNSVLITVYSHSLFYKKRVTNAKKHGSDDNTDKFVKIHACVIFSYWKAIGIQLGSYCIQSSSKVKST